MAKRNIQKANQLLFSQNMQTLGLKWSIPMPQSHLQTDILYIKCTNMKLVVTHVCVLSCVRLLVTPWTPRLLCPWNFPDKNTGVGCHFLLQGIFSTQGWNLSPASPALAGGFGATEPPGKQSHM